MQQENTSILGAWLTGGRVLPNKERVVNDDVKQNFMTREVADILILIW